MTATQDMFEQIARDIDNYNGPLSEIARDSQLSPAVISKFLNGKAKRVNIDQLTQLAIGLELPKWYYVELLMFYDTPAYHMDPRRIHVNAETKITAANLLGWWKSDSGTAYPNYYKVGGVNSGTKQVFIKDNWIALQRLANEFVPVTDKEVHTSLMGELE